MELKAYPVGYIIKYNGVRLQVVDEVQECRGCYFKFQKDCHPEIVGACSKPWRLSNVIFRKYDKNKKENLHAKKNKNIHHE